MRVNLAQLKVAVIGGGHMGEALIRGLTEALLPRAIHVTARTPARVRFLQKKYRVSGGTQNSHAVQGKDVILLCVKPQVMGEVLRELAPHLAPQQLVISVAAGISLETLQTFLPKNPVVRAMPNHPALIGHGVTGLAFGKRVTRQHRETARAIFSQVGKVCEVPESHLDAVTALGGSLPGFLYWLAHHVREGGVAAGLSRQEADFLTRNVFQGVGQVLGNIQEEPRALAQAVTSPQGTTWAGLQVLEEEQVGKAMQKALLAATRRAKALRKGL